MSHGSSQTIKMPYGWGRAPFDVEARKKWGQIPFPVEEYEGRIGQLRDRMKEKDLGGFIVHGGKTDAAAIRYLSNFEDFYNGDSLVFIPLEGEIAFVTNSIMHGEPIHSGIQNCWIPDARPAAHPRTATATTIYDHLEDIMRERGVQKGRVGLSGDAVMSHAPSFQRIAPGCEFVEAQDILPELMTIKSMAEVEVMRKSAHILDAALAAVMENAKEGITENELCGLAMEAFFRAGGTNASLPLALGSGPRAGLKHAPPTDRKLHKGEIVFTDQLGYYMGYANDASRGRVVGQPNKEQKDFLEAQMTIIERCMAAMRPGVRIKDIGKIAAETAKELEVEQWFYFRGHGIGTLSHVPPSVNPENEVALEENMVIAFEPMLVQYEFGTAVVENTIWITKDGVDILNECPWRWWD